MVGFGSGKGHVKVRERSGESQVKVRAVSGKSQGPGIVGCLMHYGLIPFIKYTNYLIKIKGIMLD